MTYRAQEIAERLRTARVARGLSQRELSALAGIPQPQISRVEAGAVDLRLSSLIALVHALDLELALVPRKAMPAVRALTQEALGQNGHHAVAVQKEMQRIGETLRGLQISMPELEGFEALQKSFTDLQRFRWPVLQAEGLKQLRQSLERVRRSGRPRPGLSDSVKLIRMLRNKAAHGPDSEVHEGGARPAYSLDEDDNDA
jgi:transcriptional regulator with XRE-family HTH domain